MATPIEQLLEDAYQGVSGLDCSGCPGDCCVSPTMTAPEFVRIMHWAMENYSPALLQEMLLAPSREHFQYADNAFCRFQDASGLCTNYQGRALACRLHGHEAMRAFAESGTEFCTRNPAGNHALQPSTVSTLVDKIRQANVQANIPYEAPYYLMSLNLECWLDLAYHPELLDKRPELDPLRIYLQNHLRKPELPSPVPSHTALAGKLNTIDRLYLAIANEDRFQAIQLLESLKNDFPSCASYYVEEAIELMSMLQNP